MSIESWKAEFYPTKACSVKTEKEAITHSLQKWTGLLEGNLNKHGCSLGDCEMHVEYKPEGGRASEDYVSIDNESCALCVQNKRSCTTCPLMRFTGKDCDWVESAWMSWRDSHGTNPNPMINLLTEMLSSFTEAKT